MRRRVRRDGSRSQVPTAHEKKEDWEVGRDKKKRKNCKKSGLKGSNVFDNTDQGTSFRRLKTTCRNTILGALAVISLAKGKVEKGG
jgi:hypothetical protein